MTPDHDDIVLEHYRAIIEDFLYEHGVEPEDTADETSDLLDVLLLNGWTITPL